MFMAAVDAAAGYKWPETYAVGLAQGTPIVHGVLRTQRRHIAFATKLLALEPEAAADFRHKSSVTLGCPALKLNDAAMRIRAGPTMTIKAMEVMAILHTLRVSLPRFLEQGQRANVWGIARVAYRSAARNARPQTPP